MVCRLVAQDMKGAKIEGIPFAKVLQGAVGVEKFGADDVIVEVDHLIQSIPEAGLENEVVVEQQEPVDIRHLFGAEVDGLGIVQDLGEADDTDIDSLLSLVLEPACGSIVIAGYHEHDRRWVGYHSPRLAGG